MKLALHILTGLFILMVTSPSLANEEQPTENNIIVTVKAPQPREFSRSAFDDLEAAPATENSGVSTEASLAPTSAGSPITINVGNKKMGESVLIKPDTK